MQRSIDDKMLMAYADGELAGEARRAVEQYLAQHPEAMDAVQAQRRLTRAAQRCIREDTPPVPRELRGSVEQILAADRSATDEVVAAPTPEFTDPASGASQPRRFVPLAVAASILLVVGAMAWSLLRGSDPALPPPVVKNMDRPPPAFDGTLSPALVQAVARVHDKCARLLNHFISPEFGETLQELSAPAEQFLGTSPFVPDLSSLNYDFNGAGPCNVPGAKTLHLLYRSREDPAQNVSVFIQPDEGQLKVEPNQLHTAAGPDGGPSMLVWRTRGLVYYILGDADEPARRAADQIANARL